MPGQANDRRLHTGGHVSGLLHAQGWHEYRLFKMLIFARFSIDLNKTSRVVLVALTCCTDVKTRRQALYNGSPNPPLIFWLWSWTSSVLRRALRHAGHRDSSTDMADHGDRTHLVNIVADRDCVRVHHLFRLLWLPKTN